MNKMLVSALVVVLGVLPVQAEIVRYVCEVPRDSSGWITSTYIFDLDTESQEVTVLDGMINHLEGGPIAGEVTEYTDAKRVFRWDVQSRDTRGQLARMSYRTAIFLNNMSVRVEATPLGYNNRFQQRGKCQLAS